MKKIIPTIKSAIMIAILILPYVPAMAQNRYLDEVFSNVTVNSDVVYANNVTVLTGTPVSSDLMMDVYEPDGDSCTMRPVIIYMHGGTFLPIIYNQGCIGTKTDSSIVEMCKRFARRGYVAVSMDYRLGWDANSIGVNANMVTGTIFQAAFRTIQDAKACVRYFRANASLYNIDTAKIALGGVGAGGVAAMNFIGLYDTLQLWMPKLICDSSVGPFITGMPFIDIHTIGDFEGFGGIPQLNNPNNNPGHSSAVQMIFSIYGNLGDSTWVNASMPPVAAIHPMNPPTGAGPYHWGTITAAGYPVLTDVSGPHQFISKLNALGVNDVFINSGIPTLNDPYSMRANAVNDGNEGVFPFAVSGQQEDMWDWYDSTAMCYTAQAIGLTCQDGLNAYYGSVANNPNMSKTQALAYIDTIQGYLAPRLFRALNPGPTNCSFVGINELNNLENNISIYPNPANHFGTLKVSSAEVPIRSYSIYNIIGKKVLSSKNMNEMSFDIESGMLPAGIYQVRIGIGKNDEVFRKIVVD